jgi:hypothetical protein
MGKILHSPLCGVSGTQGNLLGSSWKALLYLRSRTTIWMFSSKMKQTKTIPGAFMPL